jgi:hypothetical protein
MKLIQAGLVLVLLICLAALDVYPEARRETLLAMAVFGTALGVLRWLGAK